MHQQPNRHLLVTLICVGALALAACGGDSTPSEAPSTTPSVGGSVDGTTSSAPSTPTPTDTASVAPTADESGTPRALPSDHSAGDQIALQASCDLDGADAQSSLGTVSLAYPDGWLIEEDECGFFDPSMDEIDGLEPTGVDVHWTVDNAPYHEAATAETIDADRRLTATVAGRQAVRVQGTYTGDGLYPSGTRVTTWIVDLDPGTDDEGRILVGSTHEGEAIDYPHAVDVLDAMASSAIVSDNPAGQAGVDAVLAQSEGGGAPYTVTANEGCLRLQAGDFSGPIEDEVCDNVVAGDRAMRVWTLSSDTVRVAAGMVSVDVAQILVERDGRDVLTGTVPVSLEGGWAMAVPVQDGDVLHAVDADGNTLATHAV